jgi:uncharacterized protein
MAMAGRNVLRDVTWSLHLTVEGHDQMAADHALASLKPLWAGTGKDVAPSVARPILLDQVAIDFPDLVLIGIHIGVPWSDKMLAMCWKHANVYTAGDAYAPRHWPKSFVHYANTYGARKVLFGTDWPVIDPERAVREVQDLQMRPGSLHLMMRANALRIFRKLPR